MDYNNIINSSKVVMVEFFATWCPHCQRMMPVVEQIKELLDGRADIYQFDIDKNQEAADSLNVESLPTFIVYRDGKEVWRQSGEMDGQGRVLLPQALRQKFNIGKNIRFVGMGRYLEIWDEDTYIARELESEEDFDGLTDHVNEHYSERR